MQKPNIVFITTHDTGRHFGCYGNPTVQSPNIDQLAAEGVKFSNIFCASPKCSPSRAAMMTGRYPQSNGVFYLTHAPYNWIYHQDEKHLARVLAENGWSSHLFHFQHEGEDPDFLGFQHLHAMPKPHAHNEMPDPWGHVPAIEVAQDFAAFCSQEQEAPFYAQIGFFETHDPLPFGDNHGDDELGLQMPPNYLNDDKNREYFRMLQGSVKHADQAVGIILDALKRNGLDQNTLVVFTVDHGISFTRAKGTCYDLGLEVALLMRWPDASINGGKIINRMVGNIDVFPSILELVGIDVPNNVQGVSFANTVRDLPGDTPQDAVFAMIHEGAESRAVRTEKWKLIRNFEGDRQILVPIAGSALKSVAKPFAELYDLENDPMETVNLADDTEYSDIRKELETRLRQHLEAVDDPILKGPVANPYYVSAAADFCAG